MRNESKYIILGCLLVGSFLIGGLHALGLTLFGIAIGWCAWELIHGDEDPTINLLKEIKRPEWISFQKTKKKKKISKP